MREVIIPTSAHAENECLIGLLKVLQRMLDLSNRDLEHVLGLSPRYLSRLFKGLIELRMEHIVNLAQAMGFRLDEFFAIAYPPARKPPSEAAIKIRSIFDMVEPAQAREVTADTEQLVSRLRQHLPTGTAPEGAS